MEECRWREIEGVREKREERGGERERGRGRGRERERERERERGDRERECLRT